MKFILLFFSVLFATGASAQTQMEMNFKAKAQYEKADATLNKIYKKLSAMLDSVKEKDLLKKAQRAWLLFRDAHCDFVQSSFDGGSMQPLIYYVCLQEVTEERIKQLKEEIDERNSK